MGVAPLWPWGRWPMAPSLIYLVAYQTTSLPILALLSKSAQSISLSALLFVFLLVTKLLLEVLLVTKILLAVLLVVLLVAKILLAFLLVVLLVTKILLAVLLVPGFPNILLKILLEATSNYFIC